eukprot:TRINITY_DN6434_c0_g1_i1.p1 TRINITY_DN6434_c0_g1~~TRINITY_DN6434_c0_g1_i1.p1  ORF type:complete len:228 (+),score=27.64 TRINITY_DN6434_c0_g1_i1:74-685(+)
MANILEWHYVIIGPKGSVYEGGVYHGKIKFPTEYPHKPPSILMITPSGRFQTNTRLCLSMSDFHPESWNPMWSVSSILTGLLSFMLENKDTHGSISTSDADKRKFAKYSKTWNNKNPTFRKHFPELITSEVINNSSTEVDATTSTLKTTIETNTKSETSTETTKPEHLNTKKTYQHTSGTLQPNLLFVFLAIIVGIALFNHFI